MNRRLRALVTYTLALGLVAPPGAAYAADPVRDAQWHLGFLNLAEAHQISQGEGVTVAVIDTGVDGAHPDLASNAIHGIDLTVNATPDGLTDVDGHGTAMAGLVAANGRALGIAPKARVQSVRVTLRVGPLGGSSVREGIEWATRNGAEIITMSGGTSTGGADMEQAVHAAQSADIVFVAAAGNQPGQSTVNYPAAYPGVIAAVGVDQNGEHAEVSVTGPEVVLAAPAVDIASTDIRTDGHTGYSTGTGTSSATAIIAGAAALVRSKFPQLSAAEVVHRLTATADDRGPPGRDTQYGYGVVNIVRALTEDVPPLTPSAAPPQPTAAQSGPPTDDDGGGVPALPIAAAALILMLGVGLTVWFLRSRAST